MNIDLFSQGLLLGFCAAAVVLITYLCLRLSRKIALLVFAGGVLFAVAAQFITGWVTQSGDELPNDMWLFCLPFTISLWLPLAISVHRRNTHQTVTPPRHHTAHIHSFEDVRRRVPWKAIAPYSLASASLIIGAVFGLIAMNQYYHLYPTLYSALGITQPGGALPKNSDNTAQNAASTAAYNKNSIEAYLNKTPSVSGKGKLYSLTIPGTTSHFKARGGWVYVPPLAGQSGHRISFPVLIMLAGVPGSPKNWLDGGNLQNTLDTFAKGHHGITPMVFLVDDTGSAFNDTECVNSPHGNVETYLTTDVPTYIRQHFPVSSSPDNWGIGGLSMGGMCSIMLALSHPTVYHYFLDFGGEAGPEVGSKKQTINALFGGSETVWAAHQPAVLLAHNKYHGLGGYFTTGISDRPQDTKAIQALYKQTKAAGLDVAYTSFPGGHTFSIWKESFQTALPWISNRLGATTCSSSCR